MFDTLIRNGEVVDGTGRPAFTADVAITGGKIAAVGRDLGRGRRERPGQLVRGMRAAT